MNKTLNSGNESLIVPQHRNIDIVLNILEHIIKGKRLHEFDTNKQMYFMDCECKINEMQDGTFTTEDIKFLKAAISDLQVIIDYAAKEIRIAEGKE